MKPAKPNAVFDVKTSKKCNKRIRTPNRTINIPKYLINLPIFIYFLTFIISHYSKVQITDIFFVFGNLFDTFFEHIHSLPSDNTLIFHKVGNPQSNLTHKIFAYLNAISLFFREKKLNLRNLDYIIRIICSKLSVR